VSEVQRFKADVIGHEEGIFPSMKADPKGGWVQWEDYEKTRRPRSAVKALQFISALLRGDR
jgi:hypothetical protein